jgi:uncharacterized protein YjbI with pentapeptide repeats
MYKSKIKKLTAVSMIALALGIGSASAVDAKMASNSAKIEAEAETRPIKFSIGWIDNLSMEEAANTELSKIDFTEYVSSMKNRFFEKKDARIIPKNPSLRWLGGASVEELQKVNLSQVDFTDPEDDYLAAFEASHHKSFRDKILSNVVFRDKVFSNVVFINTVFKNDVFRDAVFRNRFIDKSSGSNQICGLKIIRGIYKGNQEKLREALIFNARFVESEAQQRLAHWESVHAATDWKPVSLSDVRRSPYSMVHLGQTSLSEQGKKIIFSMEWLKGLSLEEKEAIDFNQVDFSAFMRPLMKVEKIASEIDVTLEQSEKITFSMKWLKGLSLEEMEAIDFSQVDFSEFIDSHIKIPKLMHGKVPPSRKMSSGNSALALRKMQIDAIMSGVSNYEFTKRLQSEAEPEGEGEVLKYLRALAHDLSQHSINYSRMKPKSNNIELETEKSNV